jgi:serine/threonine-protein kinase
MTADVVRETLVAGRYELETQLGRGGMGEVWRARHVALKQHVAIKFLARASAAREVARKRFESEAQITAQLKTRHAVQVFDYGITESGQPYLVMELLDGETVGHRLDRLKTLTVATTATFLGQAARALERAHSVGIVHRDFKPDNLVIAVDEDGREYIKVLDFGIAKILGDLETADHVDPDPTLPGADRSSFTRTGSILGTPYYMAPEQIRNSRDIDPRADIWAFGIVAYECLTGSPPFDGQDLFELFDNIQAGRHPKASELNPALPPAFDIWFDIACAGDKEKRFGSARIAASHLGVALGDAALTDVTAAGRKSTTADDRHRPADLAHAATMASTHAGKVLSRKRRSVGASGAGHSLVSIPNIRREPRQETTEPRGRGHERAPSATERIASERRPPTQPERSKRSRLIAIALGGLAGALTVYALWPSAPAPKPQSDLASVPVAVVPPPSAATAETTATATASATAPGSASASASAQEPAPARPTRPTSSSKPTPLAAPAPSAAPVASTAPAAPTAPPAPTKSAKSAFDLPPLGI